MKLRVSAVQYQLHTISSFEQFAAQAEHYIRTASEYGTEFVLFPEFFTTQLMSIGDKQGNALTIEDLPNFTKQYEQLFTSLAAKYGMHVIGEPTSFAVKGSCIIQPTCSTRMVVSHVRTRSTLHQPKFRNGIWLPEMDLRCSTPIKAALPC